MARNQRKSKSQGAGRFSAILGVGLILMAALGIVLLLTPLGGKVKRGLKELLGREPVVVKRTVNSGSGEDAGFPSRGVVSSGKRSRPPVSEGGAETS